MTPKVFCIGFHKTGTKSLAAALGALGYRVTGPNWTNEPDIATTALTREIPLLDRFDAFQDNPWPILFRELDARHPGSKFVLTVRDPQQWLASVCRYFSGGSSPMREWIYGAGNPAGHEGAYAARYARHNEEVRAHFKDRPSDLLEMDIARGDGWEALCGFLGREAPPVPFPTENRGGSRYITG